MHILATFIQILTFNTSDLSYFSCNSSMIETLNNVSFSIY